MGIREALQGVRERIEKAAAGAGRKSGDITLMGVSKFHGIDAVREAFENGLRLFGESRVQEAGEKFPSFLDSHPEAVLHMIGRLQRNKAKAALDIFHCIQSLDRDEIIDALGKAAADLENANAPDGPKIADAKADLENANAPTDLENVNVPGGPKIVGTPGAKAGTLFPVLLELHTAEDSKSGYPDLDALLRGAEKIAAYPGLTLAGLMTLAPFTGDKKAVRASFRSLYQAGEELVRRGFLKNPVLSMGMSGDFEIAIEEGSTLIRIGSLIFGERTP
ncbi:MAG: YggS family pyridoxal phosphate enzyme [Spirochaetaceae bacterium]|jgi:uncharacterized pyridoxal phosphate-containing UPF0001 family protein|nr:YggS family pyridoxal phosphate enzyme [Spirochaetaceae bacterium]